MTRVEGNLPSQRHLATSNNALNCASLNRPRMFSRDGMLSPLENNPSRDCSREFVYKTFEGNEDGVDKSTDREDSKKDVASILARNSAEYDEDRPRSFSSMLTARPKEYFQSMYNVADEDSFDSEHTFNALVRKDSRRLVQSQMDLSFSGGRSGFRDGKRQDMGRQTRIPPYPNRKLPPIPPTRNTDTKLSARPKFPSPPRMNSLGNNSIPNHNTWTNNENTRPNSNDEVYSEFPSEGLSLVPSKRPDVTISNTFPSAKPTASIREPLPIPTKKVAFETPNSAGRYEKTTNGDKNSLPRYSNNTNGNGNSLQRNDKAKNGDRTEKPLLRNDKTTNGDRTRNVFQKSSSQDVGGNDKTTNGAENSLLRYGNSTITDQTRNKNLFKRSSSQDVGDSFAVSNRPRPPVSKRSSSQDVDSLAASNRPRPVSMNAFARAVRDPNMNSKTSVWERLNYEAVKENQDSNPGKYNTSSGVPEAQSLLQLDSAKPNFRDRREKQVSFAKSTGNLSRNGRQFKPSAI